MCLGSVLSTQAKVKAFLLPFLTSKEASAARTCNTRQTAGGFGEKTRKISEVLPSEGKRQLSNASPVSRDTEGKQLSPVCFHLVPGTEYVF